MLLSSPVLSGEDFALLDKDVSDVNRKLAMIWNVYDFFTTYAEVEDIDSEDIYILYLDIENRKKYFVRKEDREEFEKTHSVIVPYQSEIDDQSANYEINNYKTFFVRRDFIRYDISK